MITFTDISALLAARSASEAARRFAESIVDAVREPLLVLDGHLQVISASRSFYQRFQVSLEETVGRRLYDLGNRQWDIAALRELLESILPRDQTVDGFAVDCELPNVGRRKMMLNARRMRGSIGADPAGHGRSAEPLTHSRRRLDQPLSLPKRSFQVRKASRISLFRCSSSHGLLRYLWIEPLLMASVTAVISE